MCVEQANERKIKRQKGTGIQKAGARAKKKNVKPKMKIYFVPKYADKNRQKVDLKYDTIVRRCSLEGLFDFFVSSHSKYPPVLSKIEKWLAPRLATAGRILYGPCETVLGLVFHQPGTSECNADKSALRPGRELDIT